MKKYCLIFLLLVCGFSFAQSVNDYKYVLVPVKFDFSKKQNPYGVTNLTKSLLEKYGFVVYLENDDIPMDIRNANCNKLYADVNTDNGFLKTRVTIVLKDCTGKVLFSSEEGSSKEKNLQQAYTIAFRQAAQSFDQLNYKYNGTVMAVSQQTIRTTNDGTTVKTETVPVSSQQIANDQPVLFAQPIANGYQLVDATPKVVMKIFTTSSKDMYIAEKDPFKGILRNSNGNWVFEYYVDGNLKTETVTIKF